LRAWECAEEKCGRQVRSFNNYVEFLILQDCKKS